MFGIAYYYLLYKTMFTSSKGVDLNSAKITIINYLLYFSGKYHSS